MYNYILENDLDGLIAVETKQSKTGSLPKIPGYFVMSKAAKGNSGGLCIYLKQKFKHSIQKIRLKTDHNIMWLKLRSGKKEETDLYIAIAYCRTGNFHAEVSSFFATLAHDVLVYSTMGEVLVLGDFNARLGKLTGDWLSNGKWATNTNTLGCQSFLEATNLTLLNGKHAYGIPTFSRPSANANSIIDFVLATEDLACGVKSFRVRAQQRNYL